MTLQELHDRLLAWATAEPLKDEIVAAKRAHFERFGEPHEEDNSFEMRMNAFLDWWLYDHRDAAGATVIERFMAAKGGELTTEELARYRMIGKSLHSLFELRKIGDGTLRLRDLFTGSDHEVTERRPLAGLAKGDLFEARLIAWEGQLLFSGAFLHHPQAARKPILAELKRLKKAAGKGKVPEVEPFVAQLARMALKLERYRNVKVESIYDFAAGRP